MGVVAWPRPLEPRGSWPWLRGQDPSGIVKLWPHPWQGKACHLGLMSTHESKDGTDLQAGLYPSGGVGQQ